MSAIRLFLYGDDTYRSREKLQAITARYIDTSLGDTNLAILPGASLTFETWVRQVQTFPFLAKSRLVVTENLLLEGKKELLEAIETYLPKIPASTVVVFYEAGTPDKRTKLFKRLNQPKLAQQYDPLAGRALHDWIERAAQARGLALTSAQMSYLASSVGPNLWRMTNELEKLATFATTGADLSPNLLQEFVPPAETSDVFVLIEAVARGEAQRALDELDRLIRSGQAELYLFSMVVYQYRTLLLIADRYERGSQSVGAIASALTMSPYVVEKNLRLVRTLSCALLSERYRRLLDYDRAMKTGELEPRLALELLIAEFAQPRVAPGPTPAETLRYNRSA